MILIALEPLLSMPCQESSRPGGVYSADCLTRINVLQQGSVAIHQAG